jgi:hypothetical protein
VRGVEVDGIGGSKDFGIYRGRVIYLYRMVFKLFKNIQS